MAKIRFYLREPGKDRDALIYISYHCPNGSRYKAGSGRHIRPNAWSAKNQRPHPGAKGAAELSAYLNQLRDGLQKIIDQLRAAGQPITPETITAADQQQQEHHRRTATDQRFIPFLDWYIQNPPIGQAAGTLGIFRALRNHVSRYETARRRVLLFSDIDQNLLTDFGDFLRTGERATGDSNARKYQRFIRFVVSRAVRMGITQADKWKTATRFIPETTAESVYLSETDILKLHSIRSAAHLEHRPDFSILCREADRLILLCCTGLRFGDLSRITEQDIQTADGLQLLKITTQKTRQQVYIPLSPVAVEILQRYNWTGPKPISNQKANQYFKTVCELAGINEQLKITTTQAGQITARTVYKYQLITTHTGRRSFATNAILKGVPERTVRAITGHTSEKSFSAYVRLTKLQEAVRLSRFLSGTETAQQPEHLETVFRNHG